MPLLSQASHKGRHINIGLSPLVPQAWNSTQDQGDQFYSDKISFVWCTNSQISTIENIKPFPKKQEWILLDFYFMG